MATHYINYITKIQKMQEKNGIAQKAMEFVPEHGIIILDAGSTVMCLADLIKQNRKELIIITNALHIADILKDGQNTVYLLGGEYRSQTDAVSGMWALNALKSIRADAAFLGSSGFMSHSGPSAESFTEAEVKQAIMANSKTNIVLADNSKFYYNALTQYAEWTAVDALVTNDDNIPENIEEIKESVSVYY